MMLVFVSGCLAMVHLGVYLLLLFSPITSAACRCFFLCLSSSGHFFPSVTQYFTPTAFIFSFIYHSAIPASKIVL